jgi:predicted RNase H-like HicB family nuclease
MTATFTAVFEQDGDWWVDYVEELPGANTQGASLEEASENLKESVALIIEANRELARHGPQYSIIIKTVSKRIRGLASSQWQSTRIMSYTT